MKGYKFNIGLKSFHQQKPTCDEKILKLDGYSNLNSSHLTQVPTIRIKKIGLFSSN